MQATGRGCSNVLFCNESWDSNTNILYCDQCMFSRDLFGCCGIKRGATSILNTAYSQHEYETLCGKVIEHMRSTGEWGEFFPLRISPFGYNETMAHDYFPLTEEQATKLGYNWKPDDEISSYHGEYYMPLPIHQYDERKVGYDTAEKNIQACLEGIIECQHTKKPFKIIKPELAFYIENSLPIPVLSPNERYNLRAALRTPRILYERTCMECGKEIDTVYDSHRTERVLCETCYRRLVY